LFDKLLKNFMKKDEFGVNLSALFLLISMCD
jgi:hypothetical protein